MSQVNLAIHDAVISDEARRHWFGPGDGSRPDIDELLDAYELRRTPDDDMPRGEAVQVAYLIEKYYGWSMFDGVVLNVDGAPKALHTWNILPDGGILDATAELHGGVTSFVAGPDADILKLYRREWTESYNPDLRQDYPELRLCTWNGVTDAETLAETNDLSARSFR